MSLFVAGKLFYKAGEGSGGGDQHNLGWYATESALTTAYPTAEAGDWAIVGATDTVWIWDTDNSAWVDSDQKGQVTSVNNQTGAVTIGINDILPTQTGYSGRVLGTDGFVAGWVEPEIVQRDTMPQADENEVGNIYQFVGATDANYTNGYFYKCVSDGGNPATYSWTRVDVQPTPTELPSQTGNNGKYLTTNGTTASWATVDSLPSQSGQSGKFLTTNGTSASWGTINALQNNSTALKSMSVGFVGDAATDMMSTNIGYGAKAKQQGTSCGAGADANVYSVAFGNGAQSGGYAAAVGWNAKATNQNSISIGTYTTTTANYAIQLGGGTSNVWRTNADANTFKVGNANGNFEIMSADGTVPADRLKNAINKYSTMPTASADNLGWIVQFTGTTDSTYTHGYLYECVSDGQTPATYSWTAVQVQAGGGSSLPSQTGNSGKFLTTDGTDASWSDVLPNQYGHPNYFLKTDGSSLSWGLAVINSSNSGFAIGTHSYGSPAPVATDVISIAIGDYAKANGNLGSISIGYSSTASGQFSTCIASVGSATGSNSIQIGGYGATNSDANTFKVGNANGNYEIMSADGTIPTDRFTTTPSADGTYVPTLTISSGVATRSWAAPSGGGSATSTTATLATADWSSNTQTVNVTGVTASNNVIVSAAPASQADYTSAGVICAAQGAGTLTFTCTTTPSSALTVNVLII